MLIAVEGCIGTGKSTVAAGLARFRKSVPLLEAFELNPFLPQFYDNPKKYALETEFAFMFIHYHQLKRSLNEAHEEVLADFAFAKDLMYAELNLVNRKAKGVFRTLYDLLSRDLVQPDLMVC